MPQSTRSNNLPPLYCTKKSFKRKGGKAHLSTTLESRLKLSQNFGFENKDD